MAITEVKIHPAIGIARVGNSPDEWFIGPETTDKPSIPVGGYKDNECRVKRQAARFRVFAYHDDGTEPTEVTIEDASIEWTVHVANTKGLSSTWGTFTGAAIDPGPKTVSGPNGHTPLSGGIFQAELDGAPSIPVELGEVRTDPLGRLLVLGGSGTSVPNTFDRLELWYDDVADGPVSASVTIDGTTFASQAWVVVGPPNFAPTVRPVISMLDRVVSKHITDALTSAAPTTSFLRDVHPILDAAVAVNAVHSGAAGNHGSLSPASYPTLMPSPDTTAAQVSRAAIVGRLKNAGGDMPDQNADSTGLIGLTSEQFSHLERWAAGTFANDWTTAPAPVPLVPQQLDRGPLDHCIGSPLDPGVELDYSILGETFSEPLRLALPTDGGPAPGDLTQDLILPWQTDFFACTEIYWPSNRPGTTTPESGGPPHLWIEGIPDADAMNSDWYRLGFVVPQGGALVEVERCDIASITLLTPTLDFVDVPVGPAMVAGTRSLPVHFEVDSPGAEATFSFVAGPAITPFAQVSVTPVVVGPTIGGPTNAYLWVSYTTQGVPSTATASVEVEHVESGKRWTIALRGNTEPRTTTATVLVLDRSFSMSESRGDGVSKLVGLQEATDLFVAAAHEGDGIGVVEFNHTVTRDLPVAALGPVGMPDPDGRDAVVDFVSTMSPSGNTSIGDGLDGARTLLGAPEVRSYERQVVIVVTDGKETAPLWIADVADTITATTYGVGIGTPANVDVATLQALTGNHGGYLLLTGELTGDTQRRLVKHFLQILAGISNADVLLDPDGRIYPGEERRISFDVSSGDRMLDVFVIADAPERITVSLETPSGRGVDAATAGVDRVITKAGSLLRIPLPVEADPTRPERAGRWKVVLSMPTSQFPDYAITHVPEPNANPADYSVMVNVYSDLRFDTSVTQANLDPGAPVCMEATIRLGGVPIDRAVVVADVIAPQRDLQRVQLAPSGDGRFTATLDTAQLGSHQIRLRALGSLSNGSRFTREQTRTVVAELPGTNVPAGSSTSRLAECLLRGATSRRARWWGWVFGIDLKETYRCLVERRSDR